MLRPILLAILALASVAARADPGHQSVTNNQASPKVDIALYEPRSPQPLRLIHLHPSGLRTWTIAGCPHRQDGPAVLHPNGAQEWWLNGRFLTMTPPLGSLGWSLPSFRSLQRTDMAAQIGHALETLEDRNPIRQFQDCNPRKHRPAIHAVALPADGLIRFMTLVPQKNEPHNPDRGALQKE